MIFECDRCEKDAGKPLLPYRKYFICDPCADVLGVDRD